MTAPIVAAPPIPVAPAPGKTTSEFKGIALSTLLHVIAVVFAWLNVHRGTQLVLTSTETAWITIGLAGSVGIQWSIYSWGRALLKKYHVLSWAQVAIAQIDGTAAVQKAAATPPPPANTAIV